MTSPPPEYWLWNKERISPLMRWRSRWAIIKVLLEYACYLLMYGVDSSGIEYMTRRFTVEGAEWHNQESNILLLVNKQRKQKSILFLWNVLEELQIQKTSFLQSDLV